jgi:hypothetical protein
MAKLTDFTERTLDVVVDIAGTKLNLVVRPFRWTIDEETQLLSSDNAADARTNLLAFFCSVVAEWDLTDDDEKVIPITPESLSDLPSILLQNVLEEVKPAMTFRKRR